MFWLELYTQFTIIETSTDSQHSSQGLPCQIFIRSFFDTHTNEVSLIYSNYGYFSEIRSLQSSLAPISNFLIEQATLEIKARSPLLSPPHDSQALSEIVATSGRPQSRSLRSRVCSKCDHRPATVARHNSRRPNPPWPKPHRPNSGHYSQTSASADLPPSTTSPWLPIQPGRTIVSPVPARLIQAQPQHHIQLDLPPSS